ncbi:MAG: hypothetical protein WBD22_15480 [Pyrinomonadaceae bacterium]
MSKSQRRLLRKNSDLRIEFGPVKFTDQMENVFDRHRQRFTRRVPTSLGVFITPSPYKIPCEGRQVCVFEGDRLIAASFFDLGDRATSGVYAIFEPDEARRRLGIFTLLKEIEYAVETGRDYYYLGYCHDGNSFYNYKKQFRATEYFDWKGSWSPYEK